MNIIHSPRWNEENEIDEISLLYHLAPPWFDSEFVFHWRELPEFLDWMELVTCIHSTKPKIKQLNGRIIEAKERRCSHKIICFESSKTNVGVEDQEA